MKHTHLRSEAVGTPGEDTSIRKIRPVRHFLGRNAGSFLIFVGILVHTYEIRSAGQTAREGQYIQQQTTLASMMGGYFESLKEYNEIHTRLGEGGDWFGSHGGPATPEDWTTLKRYAGLLEQLEVWHRNGIIDSVTLDSTYSHRIVRIYNNDIIREELFVKERPHWRMLVRLVDILGDLQSFKLRNTVQAAVAAELPKEYLASITKVVRSARDTAAVSEARVLSLLSSGGVHNWQSLCRSLGIAEWTGNGLEVTPAADLFRVLVKLAGERKVRFSTVSHANRDDDVVGPITLISTDDSAP